MATLDVERVIRSPLFTSPCKLIHFVEGLDEFGNPTWTEGESTEVMAVITADTKTISRLPEALRREGTILVRFMIADMPAASAAPGTMRSSGAASALSSKTARITRSLARAFCG